MENGHYPSFHDLLYLFYITKTSIISDLKVYNTANTKKYERHKILYVITSIITALSVVYENNK